MKRHFLADYVPALVNSTPVLEVPINRLQAPVHGRYDRDLRFGSANPKAAFWLVKFLEDVGYDGSRHFDAHAYRTEDYEGVKDFASGCMRTYLILKERAARWNADPEIKVILAEIDEMNSQSAGQNHYTEQHATGLLSRTFDRESLN